MWASIGILGIAVVVCLAVGSVVVFKGFESAQREIADTRGENNRM